jgi:hypothetical protein
VALIWSTGLSAWKKKMMDSESVSIARSRREKFLIYFALVVEKMQKSQDSLEKRLNDLEKKSSSLGGSAAPAKPAPAKAAAKDDDDDVDLFGSSDVSKPKTIFDRAFIKK